MPGIIPISSGGGGGGGGITALDSAEVTGSPAALTITGLATTHQDLLIIGMVRPDKAGAGNLDSLDVQVGGGGAVDTGANYRTIQAEQAESAPAAVALHTGSQIRTAPGSFQGAFGNASRFVPVRIFIPQYANTAFFRSVFIETAGDADPDNTSKGIQTTQGWWNNTAAAIDSIKITGQNNLMAVGSKINVYGLG